MSESSMTDQVEELGRLMDEAEAARGRQKKVQLGLTLALVGVLGAFLVSLYNRVDSMYTAEKFQESMGPELEQLQPQIAETMRGVVTSAAPHYAELGRARLDVVLPEVRDQIGAELIGLSEGLAVRAEERASAALERVRVAQEQRLRDHFPDLDDEAFEQLRLQWAQQVQSDTTEVLGGFHTRVVGDFATLSNTIESFGPNKYDDFERDELVRYYAHLWLTLVDEEVLTGDLSGGNDG